MNSRLDLFQDLIGLPFKEGARWRDGSGCIDCYGLVLEASARDGSQFPDAWRELADAWRAGLRHFADWAPEGWKPVQDEPRARDVVTMRDEGGRPNHLAYVATDREILHATRAAHSMLLPIRRIRAKIDQVFRRLDA